MKHLMTLVCAAALTLTATAGEKPLRVLVVCNSFTLSVMKQLPKIVDAQDKYALDITNMYIGGCTLKRHVEEYEKAKKDPSHRPYSITRYVTGQVPRKRVMGNLVEMLDAPAYDVLVIQQASPLSISLKDWEPWGDRLVAILRAKNPQAKLLLHQTWSYRPGTKKLDEWKIDQEEMFERVRKVYADRAAHFGADIIPMGEAVQIYRSVKPPTKLAKVPNEELRKFVRPARPPYRGDVVGSYRWVSNRKLKKIVLAYDTTHMNPYGEYLQGCVWFGKLFGADVEKIEYAPKYLTAEDATLMRKCAARALAGETVKRK